MSATKRKLIDGIGCPIAIRQEKIRGKDCLFIATQDGKVHYHWGGKTAALVDLTNDIEVSSSLFSKGLLGMELHPSFKENNKFYLYYSIKGTNSLPLASTIYPGLGDSLCQEWTSQEMYNHVVTVEEWTHNGFYGDYKCKAERNRVMLQLKQPFGNSKGHNYLYFDKVVNRLLVATNDGGSKYDPFNLAQDENSLHGKILSINVDEDNCWDVMEPIANKYEIPSDREIKIVAKGIKDPACIIKAYNSNLALVEMGQDVQSYITSAPIGRESVDFGWRPAEGILPTMRVKDTVLKLPTSQEEEPVHGAVSHTVTWNVSSFPSDGSGKSIHIALGDSVVFKSTDSKKHDLTETDSTWKPLLDPGFDSKVSSPFSYTGLFDEEDCFYLRCNIHPDVMRLKVITKSSLLRAREVRYQKYLSKKSKCRQVEPSPTMEVMFYHEYIKSSHVVPDVSHSKIGTSAITSAVCHGKGSFSYITMAGRLFTTNGSTVTSQGIIAKGEGFSTLLTECSGELYLGVALSPTKGAVYTVS